MGRPIPFNFVQFRRHTVASGRLPHFLAGRTMLRAWHPLAKAWPFWWTAQSETAPFGQETWVSAQRLRLPQQETLMLRAFPWKRCMRTNRKTACCRMLAHLWIFLTTRTRIICGHWSVRATCLPTHTMSHGWQHIGQGINVGSMQVCSKSMQPVV